MAEQAIGSWLFDIDEEADAAYLTISLEPIVATRNLGVVNVDLDAKGNAVGIELLTLKSSKMREVG